MIIDPLEFDPARLGWKIGAEEVRKLQLDMLDALAAYCDAHGLTYYLSGGTLLGAVRHGGYIPWDDDIDINMPRPDFERLIELTGGRLTDDYLIGSPDGPIEQANSFPRMYDTRFVLHSVSSDGYSLYYAPLFIDIFPIEGLPTSMWWVRIHYIYTKAMNVMRQLAYFRRPLPKRFNASKVARFVARPLARRKGYEYWNDKLLKAAKKYRWEDCMYVGVCTGSVHTVEEYIEKEGYGKPVKVNFEGKLYSAPANTHKYLKHLYGEYMKLPPEEKRIAHHFDVWEI